MKWTKVYFVILLCLIFVMLVVFSIKKWEVILLHTIIITQINVTVLDQQGYTFLSFAKVNFFTTWMLIDNVLLFYFSKKILVRIEFADYYFCSCWKINIHLFSCTIIPLFSISLFYMTRTWHGTRMKKLFLVKCMDVK